MLLHPTVIPCSNNPVCQVILKQNAALWLQTKSPVPKAGVKTNARCFPAVCSEPQRQISAISKAQNLQMWCLWVKLRLDFYLVVLQAAFPLLLRQHTIKAALLVSFTYLFMTRPGLTLPLHSRAFHTSTDMIWSSRVLLHPVFYRHLQQHLFLKNVISNYRRIIVRDSTGVSLASFMLHPNLSLLCVLCVGHVQNEQAPNPVWLQKSKRKENQAGCPDSHCSLSTSWGWTWQGFGTFSRCSSADAAWGDAGINTVEFASHKLVPSLIPALWSH